MPWLPGTPYRLQVLRGRVIAGPVQGIHQAVHSGVMGRAGNFLTSWLENSDGCVINWYTVKYSKYGNPNNSFHD